EPRSFTNAPRGARSPFWCRFQPRPPPREGGGRRFESVRGLVSSRGQVLVRWPLGLIGLPDFDQVAVGVAEVAAGFLSAVDWRCEEVGASFAPGLVDGLDVGDADVEEAADVIGIAGRLECDAWLVVGGAAADVDDDPAVRERDDRR